MSERLTILRLKQERARREWDNAEIVALRKRQEWEKLYMEYLDEAERCGLCRYCLKPLNEGKHDGLDHVVLAKKSPAILKGQRGSIPPFSSALAPSLR